MKDSWCRTIVAKSGKVVSGGAARNVRIADAGGMDEIVEQVAREAAGNALKRANALSRERQRPKLRLVA